MAYSVETPQAPAPIVSVIMGSKSDWNIMKDAVKALQRFLIPYEYEVVSAHRTPHYLAEWSVKAEERGIKLVIAGAGGSAHLPGMCAAFSGLPVIGVPIRQAGSAGPEMTSILSILQMPPGVPVGTMAVNGAENAGIYAAELLGMHDAELRKRIREYKTEMTGKVRSEGIPADQRI